MSSRSIIEAIQKISGTKQADTVFYIPCIVTDVDVATRTCTCTPQGGQQQAPFSNVLLMASVDDGVLYVPTQGSTVVIAYSTYNQPFVCLFSHIDKIVYTVGRSTLQVIDGTIQLNDGSFGGLTKVQVLTQKLNNLENLVNDLVKMYNTHTHIVTVGTAEITSAATLATENGTLTPTQQSDIENTAVTHGV